MQHTARVRTAWRNTSGTTPATEGEQTGKPDEKGGELHELISIRRNGIVRALIKSPRLHQWAKNQLIFVPRMLAGKAPDFDAWFGMQDIIRAVVSRIEIDDSRIEVNFRVPSPDGPPRSPKADGRIGTFSCSDKQFGSWGSLKGCQSTRTYVSRQRDGFLWMMS